VGSIRSFALLALLGALACAAPPRAPLPEAARVSYRAGLEQLEAGQPFAAVRELLDAWRAAPQDADVHHALARAYRAKERLALAKWHLRSALVLEPQRHAAQLELVRLELASGRFDAAARVARVLAEDAGFERPWEALTELGWAELQAGRLTLARGSLEAALRAQPDHAPALLRLGVLERLARRPGPALACFSRALASRPPPPLEAEARVRRAQLLQFFGLDDVALEELRRASARAPQAVWGRKARRLLVGWSRKEHGEGERASAGAAGDERQIL